MIPKIMSKIIPKMMSSESALSYLYAIWRWRLLWNGDKIDENGSLILVFVYIEEVFFTYEEVFFTYEKVDFTDWGGVLLFMFSIRILGLAISITFI